MAVLMLEVQIKLPAGRSKRKSVRAEGQNLLTKAGEAGIGPDWSSFAVSGICPDT